MKPNEAITFAEIEADNRDRESNHVCGNCRNPWSKVGRVDCPNNRRTT